jgi:hypothetical protein
MGQSMPKLVKTATSGQVEIEVGTELVSNATNQEP